MKSFLLAAASICVGFPAAAATYSIENVALPSAGLATSFPTTTITIDDAAVQRGHFAIYARTGPVMIVGDVSDFVSFKSNGVTIDQTGVAPYVSLTLDLTFSPDGSITAARVDYAGISPTIDLAGSGESLTGLYSPTDNYGCGNSADCRVLGARLVAVSEAVAVAEPGAVTITALGVVGLVVWRRRFGKWAKPAKPALLTTV